MPLPNGPVAPLLRMREITKDFAAGRVLHGVDLEIEAGQIHALVGENGAGKSTLMKILAGNFREYGGEVQLEGRPVVMNAPKVGLREGVAVIYQENSLVQDLTVAENIALGREERGRMPGRLSHRATERRSLAEAEALGIELPMDTVVSRLDVGQQQMCEIVKAVARDARVLVMDEPTARLSMTERQRLFEIIRRLSDRDVGIVYISHFLEEIFAICTHVTVLRDGHRVDSRPLEGLDLHALAGLMIGDKLDTIERDTERHLASRKQTFDDVVLRLRDVAVAGKVAPVNLEVHRGEVVGFAGLQGSGRSELARALIGASPDASGEVSVGQWTGQPRHPRAAARAGVLMLPASRKDDGLISVRSVKDNVELSALHGRLCRGGWVLPARTRQVVRDMLERFAVRPSDPDLAVTSLSGGNQQKVLFARAAAAQARVLILDQPTAGVDIGAKVELYEQIDRLSTEGVAIVLISDDLSELLRLSDRIVLMHRGVAEAPRPVGEFDRTSLLAAITGPDLAKVAG